MKHPRARRTSYLHPLAQVPLNNRKAS